MERMQQKFMKWVDSLNSREPREAIFLICKACTIIAFSFFATYFTVFSVQERFFEEEALWEVILAIVIVSAYDTAIIITIIFCIEYFYSVFSKSYNSKRLKRTAESIVYDLKMMLFSEYGVSSLKNDPVPEKPVGSVKKYKIKGFSYYFDYRRLYNRANFKKPHIYINVIVSTLCSLLGITLLYTISLSLPENISLTASLVLRIVGLIFWSVLIFWSISFFVSWLYEGLMRSIESIVDSNTVNAGYHTLFSSFQKEHHFHKKLYTIYEKSQVI